MKDEHAESLELAALRRRVADLERERARRDAADAARRKSTEPDAPPGEPPLDRWRVALESAQVGVWDADLLSRRAFYSDQWKALLGCAPQELGDAPEEWIDRLHPDDKAEAVAEVDRIRRGEADARYSSEHRLRLKDGSYRWFLSRGRVVALDGQGLPARIVGAQVDIHERKRTEERQRRSEALYRQAQEVARIAHWEYDIEADALTWSDGMFDVLGLAPALARDLRAASTAELRWQYLLATHPDDRSKVQRAFERALRASEPFELEHRLIRPDGRIAHVHRRYVTELDEEGRPVRVVGTIQDITVRKEAEIALERSQTEQRIILNSLKGMLVLVLDQDLRAQWANDSLCEYFGQSWEELRGRRCHEIKHGLDAPCPGCVAAQAFIWGTVQEGELIDPDGRRWVTRGIPIRFERGRPTSVVHAFFDVTQLKMMEADLVRAKEAAEAASRAKSLFLANTSHEIRTPLNGILGLTELALLEHPTPKAERYLQMIKKSGLALKGIINAILDMSKIEAGGLTLDPQPFRLRELLESALTPLAVTARAKGLILSQELPPEVPDGLVGDHGKLRQILINLTGNAIKFTPRGAVRLVAAVDGHASPDVVRLLFRVEDTGVGIPPEKLEAIFESFSQADPAAHDVHGGTGLGLAISRNLAEILGGSLTVESVPGQGSAFLLAVPLALAPAAEAVPPAPEPAAVRRLRILLAEDEAVNRLFLEDYLGRQGHAVTPAKNGLEALERLREQPFDLVLMDVKMPRMDGPTAVAALRRGEAGEINARVRVTALTAHAFREDRERYLAAGMDDYLAKPVSLEDLDAVLRRTPARRDAPAAPGA